MSDQTIRHIFTLFVFAVVSATVARAQSPVPSEAVAFPAKNNWQVAQSLMSSRKKVFVVTLDQPQRRQVCRIRSFTLDELVCSRKIGAPRIYNPQQVLALILPGDGHLELLTMIALNAGLGAAIWGTVVLTATCPVCAVATGIAAFLFFDAAGAELFVGYAPDQVLYLAPGQQLTGKLSSVQPL